MKVVFVGHEASRSGAPMVLLHLIRWLRSNTDVDARVLLAGPGPLLADYRAMVDTAVLDRRPRWRRIAGPVRGVRGTLDTLPTISRRETARTLSGADVVYVNTIAAVHALESFDVQTPRIVHLHEMRYALEVLAGDAPARAGVSTQEYLAGLLASAAAIIVPSERSREDLEGLVGGALLERMRVIPEMIEVGPVRARAVVDERSARAALGVPDGIPVVIGCGTPEWRKGTDLFPHVAAAVIRSFPTDAHFAWVGFPTGSRHAERTRIEFNFDVAALGLTGRVHAVPATDNPAPYLKLADVFLLPSREDPFPLVVLEAAAVGTPTVCFDSVGIAEVVASGGGLTVPYLDVSGMGAAVGRLLEARADLGALGTGAAANADRYDVGVIAPKIFELIRATAGVVSKV